MAPKFSKKELDKMERELARSFPANPPENDNQKWSRWKNKLANQPKPKARHLNIQTPTWISGDEIDAMFACFADNIQHGEEIK